MKKIMIAVAAVGFLAAGCSGSSTTSMTNSSPAPTGQEAMQSPAPTPTMANTQPSAATQAQVNSEVNNPGDAVNLLVNQSSNEQSSVANSDDSDLTGSDSTSLNSFTGVSNGY